MSEVYEPYSVPKPDRKKGPPRGCVYVTIRHGRDIFPSPGLIDLLNLKRGETYAVEINQALRRIRLTQVAAGTPGCLVLHRSGGPFTTCGRNRVYTRARQMCADLGIPGYMTHVCRSRGWIEERPELTKLIEFEYPERGENASKEKP